MQSHWPSPSASAVQSQTPSPSASTAVLRNSPRHPRAADPIGIRRSLGSCSVSSCHDFTIGSRMRNKQLPSCTLALVVIAGLRKRTAGNHRKRHIGIVCTTSPGDVTYISEGELPGQRTDSKASSTVTVAINIQVPGHFVRAARVIRCTARSISEHQGR